MHQPHPNTFQPATYVCADCEIEHNGDVSSLPQGWDRVKDPQTKRVTVRCPDCLECIERDYADAWCNAMWWALAGIETATTHMGRAAAAYRGGVGQ